jgi:hypothetical protein
LQNKKTKKFQEKFKIKEINGTKEPENQFAKSGIKRIMFKVN